MNMHAPTTGQSYDDEPDELNEHWVNPGDPDGVVAREKEHLWQHDVPASRPKVVKPPYEERSRWRLALGVFIVVVLVVVGAYFLGFQKARAPFIKKQQVAQQKAERKPTESVTVPAKHYDSAGYSLSFDYPGNWAISDTDAKLTVLSPAFTMPGLDGSKLSHVLITVQNQQSSIAGFPAGGATASLDSALVKYKQPSGVQRAQTYLSYLGYTGPGSLDALFLTGDNGYAGGQHVPLADITAGNPLVSVTFQTCSNSYCASGSIKPYTIAADQWSKTSYSKQVMSLLESLVFN